jgi:predicted DNA-binding transcriptional regulator YafY
VAITPAPGGSPVEAAPGDELVIAYDGEARHVRVLAVMPWGIRAWDLDKQATRSFRYEKICQGKARETDGAAQG